MKTNISTYQPDTRGNTSIVFDQVREDIMLTDNAKTVFVDLFNRSSGTEPRLQIRTMLVKEKHVEIYRGVLELGFFGYARRSSVRQENGEWADQVFLSPEPIFGVDPDSLRKLRRHSEPGGHHTFVR